MPRGHAGEPRTAGSGRAPGTPNKATQSAREAIADFVDGNVDRLTSWLDAIAAKDPDAAFKAFMSVVEYHIPKLARAEITGKDGKDFKFIVQTGVPEKKDDEELRHMSTS